VIFFFWSGDPGLNTGVGRVVVEFLLHITSTTRIRPSESMSGVSEHGATLASFCITHRFGDGQGGWVEQQ
jgi:hypothetical protein